MRERIRDKERLIHIIEAIDNIFEFSENCSLDDFINNKMLKFAVIKNLEIIGEASNLLTNKTKDSNTQIDWKAIIGLRHVLVHGYYQISNVIVWNTITEDLADFKAQIEKIINSLI